MTSVHVYCSNAYENDTSNAPNICVQV